LGTNARQRRDVVRYKAYGKGMRRIGELTAGLEERIGHGSLK